MCSLYSPTLAPYTGTVFVLKSYYNPVWVSFNIHELSNRINESWRSSLANMAKQMQRVHAGAAPRPELTAHTTTWSLGGTPEPAAGPQQELPAKAGPSNTVQRTLEDVWFPRKKRDSSQTAYERSRSPSGTRAITPGSEEGRLGDPTAWQGPSGSVAAEDEDDWDYSRSDRASPAEALSTRSATKSPSNEAADKASSALIFTGTLRRIGTSHQQEFERALDVEALGFFDRRWLVSKKKNKTLSDFTNLWRKNVLNIEAQVAESNTHGPDLDLNEWQ